MSVPYIIEQGPNNTERVYDLYSRLLKDRIIFIRGPINFEMADAIVAQLLHLENESAEKDIFMYINSPGGFVDAMYAIFDTMAYITPEITTIAFGQAISAASFLLSAGAKGRRYSLPNTSIMIHELSTGTEGRYNDIKNHQRHLDLMYENMAKSYAVFTGQKLAKIKKDMERDYYMTAEEAVKYGLIDAVQYKRG